MAKHCWEADHNFICDQKKVVDRDSRLICRRIKETIHSLKSPNHIKKISYMFPEIWFPNLQQFQLFFYFYFFNCYLAAPQPTLYHHRGGSLTHQMLIIGCYIFDPEVTGNLVTKLDSQARPRTWQGLNQEPPNSDNNALTHQANLPYLYHIHRF